MRVVLASLFTFLFLYPLLVHAQTFSSREHQYKVTTLTSGLNYPWALAFLPDGDMLVTLKAGRLVRLDSNGNAPRLVKGLPPIVATGQGGLLDVILHPDFEENKYIFLSYVAPGDGDHSTAVARGRLNGSELTEVEQIFVSAPRRTNGLHFGSRLLFGPDGKLYITLGERYDMHQAQDISSHLGSIIRVNEDGSVPADNPFTKNAFAQPEIFSYGHRNVQGIIYNSRTQEIWAHEHGPKGGDEINVILSGANYGWPKITYGVDYSGEAITDKTHLPGMEQPLLYWDPSIAPCGMTFYTGDKFPDWRGDVFVGALAGQHLRRVAIDYDDVTGNAEVSYQEALLGDIGERIRDVRQGPDGNIYVLTDGIDGKILIVSPE